MWCSATVVGTGHRSAGRSLIGQIVIIHGHGHRVRRERHDVLDPGCDDHRGQDPQGELAPAGLFAPARTAMAPRRGGLRPGRTLTIPMDMDRDRRAGADGQLPWKNVRHGGDERIERDGAKIAVHRDETGPRCCGRRSARTWDARR